MVGVTGHFISYTFIVVIIRDVVGVHGPHLAWLLAAYGVAGLTGMVLLARPGDRRPKADRRRLPGRAVAGLRGAGRARLRRPTTRSPLWRSACSAIVLWGAMATAMPPMLQSAAMRHSPEDPDGASGLYVAMFQVGIMAGSLAVVCSISGPAYRR